MIRIATHLLAAATVLTVAGSPLSAGSPTTRPDLSLSEKLELLGKRGELQQYRREESGGGLFGARRAQEDTSVRAHELRERLEEGELWEARRHVRKWVQTAASKPLRRLWKSVLTDLDERIAKLRKRFTRRATSLTERVRKRVREAEKPEALDGVVAAIGGFRDRLPDHPEPWWLRRIANRMERAQEILGRWQKTIAAQKAGLWGRALNSLGEIDEREAEGLRPVLPAELVTKRFDELIDRVHRSVTTAVQDARKRVRKNPYSLGAVSTAMVRLARLERRLEVNSKLVTGVASQVDGTAGSLRNWVTVLINHRLGNWNGAARALEDLRERRRRSRWAPVVPEKALGKMGQKITKHLLGTDSGEGGVRKRLGELVEEARGHEAIARLLERTRRFEDSNLPRVTREMIDHLGRELSKLQTLSQWADTTNWEDFWRAYRQIYDTRTRYPHWWLDATARLRLRIVKHGLRDALPGELFKGASANRPVGALLRAAARERGRAGKWREALTLWRHVEELRGRYGMNRAARDGHMSVRHYLLGRQSEKHGLYRDAATHYRKAANALGRGLPVKQAAKRLRRLREAHPEVLESDRGS